MQFGIIFFRDVFTLVIGNLFRFLKEERQGGSGRSAYSEMI